MATLREKFSDVAAEKWGRRSGLNKHSMSPADM